MPDNVPHQEWHLRHSPCLIAVGVMLATFMQVLDTSIAIVTLPGWWTLRELCLFDFGAVAQIKCSLGWGAQRSILML